MMGLGNLMRRNVRLFFKDKGMFFTSLITPMILLVLYATFLAKVYRDSFTAALPAGFSLDSAVIDATVGGQLISSLLAVSRMIGTFDISLIFAVAAMPSIPGIMISIRISCMSFFPTISIASLPLYAS